MRLLFRGLLGQPCPQLPEKTTLLLAGFGVKCQGLLQRSKPSNTEVLGFRIVVMQSRIQDLKVNWGIFACYFARTNPHSRVEQLEGKALGFQGPVQKGYCRFPVQYRLLWFVRKSVVYSIQQCTTESSFIVYRLQQIVGIRQKVANSTTYLACSIQTTA